MNLNRRGFLTTTTAALALPKALVASPNVLRAEPVQGQILPVGENTTAMLGFNGSTPGPALRLRQGEELAVRFENRIDEGSSVHWHGIRLENAMDGVPGLTQDIVQPGEDFDYRFSAPDAGTYWYHSHNRSWEQVAKGLYGSLIVEEINPPQVDHDITVMIDDWRIEEDGTLMGGFENMHDFAHAGRLGNYAKVMTSQDTVKQGDRIRLRLINTATARVFPIRIEGLDGRVVAVDGMPLATPRALADVVLAPAQRMDVIGDVTGPVNFIFIAQSELYEMGSIATEGQKERSAKTIEALPAANVTRPKDQPDHALILKMEGGAMAGRHAGDDIWAFNGVSGMPDAPWATLNRGDTVTFDLVNDTSFPHGIHLHGQHFYEVGPDGALGDLRDTSLVERGETQKITAVLDNPGKWLLHCHMLGHQASGMKTWIEVL